MAEESALTSLPATPVTYRFVSVHRIVGFSELRATSERPPVQELPLDLGVAGVTAALSADPNAPLREVDRGTAVGHLMLMGFAGHRAPADLLGAVHAQAAQYGEERLKKFGANGVCLVLEAQGELVTVHTDVARDLEAALFAFDAIDKKALRAQYLPLVSAALTAVALAVNTTPDVTLVGDGLAVTLPDGRPLYSLTVTGGNVNLTTARPATGTDARAIEKVMAALLADERLSTPSRLLVDALRSTADPLEAFLFGWAALEMVIRKYTVGCEQGDWVPRVPEGSRTAAGAFHQEFLAGKHQWYSLAARTRVFALTHGMGLGEDLATEVTRIRTAFREPLYHQGAIADPLPVAAVVTLLRQVIAAAVSTA